MGDAGEFYMHKGQEILALMEELQAMPEKRVVDELKSFRVSVFIYGRNHQALTGFLDFFKNDPSNQDIWHQQSIRKLKDLHYEISCWLQNYVASVEALQAHADTVYAAIYQSSGKFPEYRDKMREFRAEPVVHFVSRLRNVVLHGETAKTMFQARMSDDFSDNQVGLPAVFFQKHKTWFKGAAKDYLKDKSDSVDIPTMVTECDEKVTHFVSWFDTQTRSVSAEDLQKFYQKNRELVLLQVDDALEGWFFNPNPEKNSAPSDFGLFHGLFDQSEFDELDRFPKGSLGRADRAVELLQAHYGVPDELKNKIRRAYTDPNFFKWDAFKPLTLEAWEAKYAEEDTVEPENVESGDAS